MKNWILLCLLFTSLTSFAQSGYNYTYTDPCTLSSKSIFIPAGSGVVVNYFDSHNTFTANDFINGVFENWIAQVSQANSSSPCSSVTTALVTSTNASIVNNTINIVTNVISISSLAQSMATLNSSMGGALSSTTNGISNLNVEEKPSTNQIKPNGSGNNTRGDSQSSTGNQTPNQSQTNNQTPQGTGSTTPIQGGNNSNPNQPTQNGEPSTQSSVDQGTSGSSGNTANSVSNAIDGNNSEGSSSSSSSKKQSNAKSSSGSLIASGDVVVIASADNTEKNQYRFVSSITHANTRGTRIKGALFNFTTGVNNANLTLYKSWINKKRSLNTIVANSTMMDFDKNIFNTTTGLESFKFNNSFTGMFGLNFTIGKMGERKFMNLSAVGGGHGSFKVNKSISTSILALAIYSPFTQFYEGKWWDAGLLIVPFNSWDLKITKTFKYNISFTGVYQLNQRFLNYQVLTGGKLTF